MRHGTTFVCWLDCLLQCAHFFWGLFTSVPIFFRSFHHCAYFLWGPSPVCTFLFRPLDKCAHILYARHQNVVRVHRLFDGWSSVHNFLLPSGPEKIRILDPGPGSWREGRKDGVGWSFIPSGVQRSGNPEPPPPKLPPQLLPQPTSR